MKYFDMKPVEDDYTEWLKWLNWVQCRLLLMLAALKKQKIEVKYANEQDWEFVFVDAGNGIQRMTVF